MDGAGRWWDDITEEKDAPSRHHARVALEPSSAMFTRGREGAALFAWEREIREP